MTAPGGRDARRIELGPPTTEHVSCPTTDPRMAIYGHRGHDRAAAVEGRLKEVIEMAVCVDGG